MVQSETLSFVQPKVHILRIRQARQNAAQHLSKPQPQNNPSAMPQMNDDLKEENGVVISYHGPPKPACLEIFWVNNLVFRWPKPLFFMVLGAHGI